MVGSAPIVNLDRGIGRMVIEQNEQVEITVHRQVETLPQVETYAPPATYDFMTGIEAMRDGGVMPDWSGCGKVQPFRETVSTNKMRYEYNKAFSTVANVDYLYNPTNTELFLYPHVNKIFYTGHVDWHAEMAEKQRKNGKEILTKEQGVGLMSFDGFDGTYPPAFVFLVPHPIKYRTAYDQVETYAKENIIHYRWQDKRFHVVDLDMFAAPYLSTAQVDTYLGRNDRAYWLFYSTGLKFHAQWNHLSDTQYSPSFRLNIEYTGEWKDHEMTHEHRVYDLSYPILMRHPYVSRMREGGEFPTLGTRTWVDFDQVLVESRNIVKYDVTCDDRRRIGGPVSDDGDPPIVGKLFVYVETDREETVYVGLPGRTYTVESVLVGDEECPVWNGEYNYMRIFLSEVAFKNAFVELLLSRQDWMTHRGGGYRDYTTMRQLEVSPNDTIPMVQERHVADNLNLTSVPVIVSARIHSRLMLSPRYRHEGTRERRFVYPKFQGVTTGVAEAIWEKINVNRQTKISFTRPLTQGEIEGWLKTLKRNMLVGYYDRRSQAVVAIDLYSFCLTHDRIAVIPAAERKEDFLARLWSDPLVEIYDEG